MASELNQSFDPKSFLAKVGEGRSVGKCGKDQIVFSQGDPADAVFYIQKGKAKVTVANGRGPTPPQAGRRTLPAPRVPAVLVRRHCAGIDGCQRA